MSPEIRKVIGGETVKVFYNGDNFDVPKLFDEDQVRQVMSEQFPDIANAQMDQAENGNWTITREAGSKGL